MEDVHKNINFVKGNYRHKLVMVLHSVIDNYFKTSLIQARINALNKNKKNLLITPIRIE